MSLGVMGTVIGIVRLLFRIYFYLVIAYILMSWLPNARESAIGQAIGRVVEPYLAPFRRVIPPIGFIDISPIAAIFALHFLELGVITVIGWIAKMF